MDTLGLMTRLGVFPRQKLDFGAAWRMAHFKLGFGLSEVILIVQRPSLRN
jgi:hypothetical protein